MGFYLKAPGMRQDGSLRPTQDGTGLAKDVSMLGIGLGFVIEALTEPTELLIEATTGQGRSMERAVPRASGARGTPLQPISSSPRSNIHCSLRSSSSRTSSRRSVSRLLSAPALEIRRMSNRCTSLTYVKEVQRWFRAQVAARSH